MRGRGLPLARLRGVEPSALSPRQDACSAMTLLKRPLDVLRVMAGGRREPLLD